MTSFARPPAHLLAHVSTCRSPHAAAPVIRTDDRRIGLTTPQTPGAATSAKTRYRLSAFDVLPARKAARVAVPRAAGATTMHQHLLKPISRPPPAPDAPGMSVAVLQPAVRRPANPSSAIISSCDAAPIAARPQCSTAAACSVSSSHCSKHGDRWRRGHAAAASTPADGRDQRLRDA